MNIADIEDKDLRELAELRREQERWSHGVEDLSSAFFWDATPERAEFWQDVDNGVIKTLDNE